MKIKNFSHIINISSLIFVISSCTNQSAINKEFEKKYSHEVHKINASRQNNLDLSIKQPIQTNIQQKYHLPDGQIFSSGHASSQFFPDDIFEIKYQAKPHPAFRQTGLEFDSIAIPQSDAFGVDSDLHKKEYLFAGNDAIQRNIDKMHTSQSHEDIEFSDILISENKVLRRKKKYNEIFGNDDLSMQKNEEKSEEELAEEQLLADKKAKRNDPFTKMIGSQVVQQNLRANNPQAAQDQKGGNLNKK